ncbi:transposase, partial [Klebsiella pneumoniae]|uniref:transposase n=1 Tax=Klebsiella pneumoniae TaxID=573 RepID=UPI001D0E3844
AMIPRDPRSPAPDLSAINQPAGRAERRSGPATLSASIQSINFWANEAVFQMMMLSYNLFLLFKFDSLDSSEYRQQIKTFRLKYVFLAAKIIKTARYVIMKLSENYPYKGVYEKCLV